MASTPPINEEFLREVDDELRRDDVTRFWKRWGMTLLIAIVIGLVALAGFLYWQNRQTEARAAQGEALSGAFDDLDANRIPAAEAKLAPLIAGETPGYRASARLTLAAAKLKANDAPGAAALYKAISDDAGLPQPYRDLGLVRWTAIEYDQLKPEQVIARLGKLAVRGNPWHGSAGEMVAVAHLNAGRNAEAGRIFKAMAGDEQVPETIRQRAVQMAGLLGVDAVAAAGEAR